MSVLARVLDLALMHKHVKTVIFIFVKVNFYSTEVPKMANVLTKFLIYTTCRYTGVGI